ncbi:MAG: hypothetical protein CSA36_08240 [Draconibacterium sp.]|nr:MAG: hypothetical protein CSA36_08240 [Draconibacterium sp.]
MKKYLNTISAFQIFQLVRYSTLLLIGVVFTKTALSTAEIGEYETFVFVAGAVSFFWLNGLQKALLPLAGANGKTNIFNAFVVIQVLSVFACIVLIVAQPLLSHYLLNGEAVPQIRLLLLVTLFGPAAGLIEYFYLVKAQSRSLVLYALVSFFIQFVLVALPAVMDKGIVMAMKGLVLVTLLRYAWFWTMVIKGREVVFSKKVVRDLLKLGAPLVAATALSGSAQFVDGFIVTSRFDTQTFAVFRYGARELPLVYLLANALSNAMLPAFANRENLNLNLALLKKSVSRLMHYLFPLSGLFLLVSYLLFPLIFNAGFKESATIFNIYLLLIISRLVMPQTILNGLRISKPIMLAALLELVINVLLSLLFVQFWGISGIAYATVIAYSFEKVYLAVVVKKRLQVSLKNYLPLKMYFIYSVGLLSVFIFVELFLRP